MAQFRRLGSRIAVTSGRAGTPGEVETARRSEHLVSVDWEQVRREKVIVGTPEMVIERIHELTKELQLSSVVAEFNAGGLMPREKIETSLRLFCEKVIPAFK